jgi:hypothetical protein
MTTDIAITLAIIVTSLVLFATEKLRLPTRYCLASPQVMGNARLLLMRPSPY